MAQQGWSWLLALVGWFSWSGLPVRAEAVTPWSQLPENTAFVLWLDTSATAWERLTQFQLFKHLEEAWGITPSPIGLPLLPPDLDFQAQVQPWIGDTAVLALLPAEPGTGAAIADHLVMVAPIADPVAFAESRADILRLREGIPDIRSFGDTLIYVWPAPVALQGAERLPEGDGPEGEPSFQQLDFPLSRLLAALQHWVNPASPQSPGITITFSSSVSLPVPHRSQAQPSSADRPEAASDLDQPLPRLPNGGDQGLALAVLPDALLVAESSAALEQFLTFRQAPDRPRLADHPEFQRSLANWAETRSLIAIYGNPLELLNFDWTMVWPALGLPTPEVTPEMLQRLGTLNFGGTLEGLLYPTNQGVQFRGRYYYDGMPFSLGLTATPPEAEQILDQLPGSSLIVVSGHDLAGFWRGLFTALDQVSEATRQGLVVVRSGFTALTGLDLDRDVLGWMDGEFAIALFPATGSPLETFFPDLPLGLGVLLQTSDRATAEQTLTTLDGVIASWGTTVSPRAVNQLPVTSWEFSPVAEGGSFLPQTSFLSHGWAKDDTLVVASGVGPMARLLPPPSNHSLADYFLFRQATASFPRPNNGYAYVNLSATMALLYPILDAEGERPWVTALKPVLGSLRSFSATTAQTPGYVEVDGLLGLAQRRD